jgi:hypothetical protein
MGSIVSSISKDTEAEMNRRLQALDLDRLELGEVKQIGGFFSKTDAYGFGLVTVVKMGGREAKMGMGGVLLRVRKRLLFGYLYSEYKGVETADWLRKTTEQWADAIQAANRDAAPAAQPARARVPAKQ